MPIPRWIKLSGVVVAVVLVVVVAGLGWTYHVIARSLPLLNGEIEVIGLAAPVTIERDALGVPSIRGSGRLDVARALGFLHAQERFFQMDLMRRQAAGELAEIFGAQAVKADRASRVHRFRWRSRQRVAELPEDQRALLAAYADGVNSGLEALDGKPFEYVLLRIDPSPWMPEDSFLVLFSMYFVLNDATGERESDLGLLHDILGDEWAAFLAPPGTEWDAPVQGDAFKVPALPSIGDLPRPGIDPARRVPPGVDPAEAAPPVGSNNWAVGGSRTADGRAILANDMHLPLNVPNTWYRALVEWPADDGCGETHRMVGATLPGTPSVLAGSNTRVAWGFTNSYGDWVDLVILEVDPEHPDRYRKDGEWQPFERVTETISVRDAEAELFEFDQTVWGPVIDRDHRQRPRALRWIAHDAEGANFAFIALEHARSVPEAIEVANGAGIPPQNFVCADAGGSVGWTIAGSIPRRVGFSGRIPTEWTEDGRGWQGWLTPEEYPRIVDPPDGLIWTANARVISGEGLEVVGDGGYALGARARQIRNDLKALEKATEMDMLQVQLDDRAVFLDRWRDLVLELLDAEALAGQPARAEFRDLIESSWSGRASVDSVAFRLVRAFRSFALERIFGWMTAECGSVDPDFNIGWLWQDEGPLWLLVTERPPHLLPEGAVSWRDELLAVVDITIGYFTENGARLADRSWGDRNTLTMRHPLSRAIPALSGWLDMPRQALPGDTDMPRVQSPTFGASERMAISPGREEDAYFHMPGGQSGHPLSAYYRAGHDAWVAGGATPLLPGATEHTLLLRPAVN